jgi:enoyl-CoA hydratase
VVYVTSFNVEREGGAFLGRLHSEDGTNRLTRSFVETLSGAIRDLASEKLPIVITGNKQVFSAGADLNEIGALSGPSAYEFSKAGQELMQRIQDFPAPVVAAISGYCMGGGLDLALACTSRIASPHSIFGHRGAALGLITGWGGTQRLPRLIGRARAMEMLIAAEKLSADRALEVGLIDAIADDPVAEALRRATSCC